MICDWTDKRKYLVHYGMLYFHVRHGMVFGKVHEIVSFRQNKCLEDCKNFKTQNGNQAVNDFEKVSITYSLTLFTEKQWKIIEIEEK